MNWSEYLKFPEKTPTKTTTINMDNIIDGRGANGGRGVGELLTPQVVHSNQEYTIISETEETIFAEDETGAPHVFTIEEWNAINGKKNDGTGFLLVAAIAAGLMLL